MFRNTHTAVKNKPNNPYLFIVLFIFSLRACSQNVVFKVTWVSSPSTSVWFWLIWNSIRLIFFLFWFPFSPSLLFSFIYFLNMSNINWVWGSEQYKGGKCTSYNFSLVSCHSPISFLLHYAISLAFINFIHLMYLVAQMSRHVYFLLFFLLSDVAYIRYSFVLFFLIVYPGNHSMSL